LQQTFAIELTDDPVHRRFWNAEQHRQFRNGQRPLRGSDAFQHREDLERRTAGGPLL
jgi:hypothetical protein